MNANRASLNPGVSSGIVDVGVSKPVMGSKTVEDVPHRHMQLKGRKFHKFLTMLKHLILC